MANQNSFIDFNESDPTRADIEHANREQSMIVIFATYHTLFPICMFNVSSR